MLSLLKVDAYETEVGILEKILDRYLTVEQTNSNVIMNDICTECNEGEME